MPSEKTPPLPQKTDLAKAMAELGLNFTAQTLPDLISRATRTRWSPTVLLEEMVAAEKKDRAAKGLARRQERSHVGRFKPIADFDWNWPKEIDRLAVERALNLEFLTAAENVILVAAQGLGKTMIAKNIAFNAILAGHTALCVSASDLLFDLGRRDSATALEGRIRHYASVTVLLIDELGYLSYDSRAADLLFQTLARRYEKKPTILTTNLAFSEWSSVFPNAMCATTMIDRLTHHSEIIAIEGESYRKREAELAKQARRARSKR